jgi:hypothetical protein
MTYSNSLNPFRPVVLKQFLQPTVETDADVKLIPWKRRSFRLSKKQGKNSRWSEMDSLE